MDFKNKTVAVIGLGNIGKTIARNLVKSGHSVILSARTLEHAQLLVKELGDLSSAEEVTQSIRDADIIVLAVWLKDIKEIIATNKELFVNKVVIDPSNPIKIDGSGNPQKIIGVNESSGEEIKRWLPASSKLIKALGTLAASLLSENAFSDPRNVLFYATSAQDVRLTAESLIQDIGYLPYYVGDITESIKLEVFGSLNGHVVNLDAANKLVKDSL
ncbi:NADP oxidoreductase coenzyme F420-dependent [Lactiplantibacillus plantarum]|nr:NADP oxidoreductase coenzyme F420-dependent [Lactiplantibacillus plantarum]MCT3271877.1 NADP oxidoreductase coenzyme F420-dependent [Lactiplantibacillus plantarum]